MSNAHVCKTCGERKPAEDMIKRAGKPSSLCRACFAATLKGKKKPKATVTAAPALALDLERGYGLRASVENGILAIEQDQENDAGELQTTTLVLSRTEAKVLFAQFAEWVA